MKIHPIELAYNKLNHSIKNTALSYVEGTNILVKCLACNAQRTEFEVIEWLKNNNIELMGLDTYIIRDD